MPRTKGSVGTDRLRRILEIIGSVSPKSFETIPELSTRYKCHEKTIRRDLFFLRQVGFDIFIVREGFIRCSRATLLELREIFSAQRETLGNGVRQQVRDR